MENSSPRKRTIPHNLFIAINRSHALIHGIALAFLVYYRASFFFQDPQTRATPSLPWLLLFLSELSLCFVWLIGLPFRWRPTNRAVLAEELPRDDDLPPLDVFIFTADPNSEPTVDVMNTVVSAMALDYPAEKFHVYLSDDAGASVTLHGMREAWKFARSWLPFCRKYGVKTRCPKAYFSAANNDEQNHYSWSPEFIEERDKIKEKYEMFRESILYYKEYDDDHLGSRSGSNSRDHQAKIEVIQECPKTTVQKEEAHEMPLLVYVSREKRPAHSHHFKAGAINVLLRVSGVISNSPYILGLDCDMYSNDPTSAKQAMRFHLDPKISPSLAFVIFPQKFHNISKHDIYDSAPRFFYEVGFLYQSVVEDFLTGFTLHCKGWKSIFLNPARPQFLGTITTNLNEGLIQTTRWISGSVEVGISKFCPLIYGPLKMSLLQSMCYAELSLYPPFWCLSSWCIATIPQLCLLYGIPLYPEVSSSFFLVFLFVFISSLSRQLYEVLVTGGSIRIMINAHRAWMMKTVTCHFYGSLDAIMKKFGLREASFLPTNKVEDDEHVKRYQKGIFDFQIATMFLAPLVTIVILNMASLFAGIIRIIISGNWDKMFAQVFLSFYILVISYPILEGMVLRKDRGQIRSSVTLRSAILCMIFLSLGPVILLY
ncbi:hypothetical protein Tsubulata_050623 [Turnera subulata]|uniref:Cellulose synthase-like protein G2 n=1 Tax=Turnera subulata TaxID=218843 RepID=A0A9Q0EXU4_9ROSI|nr:hypothetical protein Tsubulata_050623 [Turnera subulata]